MAFQALSLTHDALKGTQGVHVNGYAVAAAGIEDQITAQKFISGSQAYDPSAVGTTVSIVSQATSNAGGAGTASTGTAVTVADSSVFSVGDVVIDPGSSEERVVTVIVDGTTLTINAAFTVDLAGVQLTSHDTVYHTSECVRNGKFQGVLYFADSLPMDVPVLDEAVLVAVS